MDLPTANRYTESAIIEVYELSSNTIHYETAAIGKNDRRFLFVSLVFFSAKSYTADVIALSRSSQPSNIFSPSYPLQSSFFVGFFYVVRKLDSNRSNFGFPRALFLRRQSFAQQQR
jgi:hypothetical protein